MNSTTSFTPTIGVVTEKLYYFVTDLDISPELLPDCTVIKIQNGIDEFYEYVCRRLRLELDEIAGSEYVIKQNINGEYQVVSDRGVFEIDDKITTLEKLNNFLHDYEA